MVWSRLQERYQRVPEGSGAVGDITWAYFALRGPPSFLWVKTYTPKFIARYAGKLDD